MHRDFGTWLREVDFPAGGTSKTNERWEGAKDLVNKARSPEIEGMLRILHQSRVPVTKETLESTVGSFSAHDPSFDARKHKRELEMLCGATLSYIIETDDSYALASAISIKTASFLDQRRTILPVDIVHRAESSISRHIEDNRDRPDLEKIGKKAIKDVSFANAIATLQSGDDSESLQKAMSSAAADVQVAIQSANVILKELVQTFGEHFKRHDEETQILWWLLNGRSVDLGKPFDKLTIEERTLAAPKELEDLIQVAPGPNSITSLLQRAGIKPSPKKTIASIITGNDLAWLEKLVEDLEPSSLCLPVHLAIKKQVENGKGDEWVANWSKVAQVDASATFSPLDVAHHFYYERLLISESD